VGADSLTGAGVTGLEEGPSTMIKGLICTPLGRLLEAHPDKRPKLIETANINLIMDALYPNGVFYARIPPLTQELWHRMPKKKKTPPQDPHRNREAEKYQNPIVSREFILAYLTEQGEPRDFKVIAQDCGITDVEEKIALDRRLFAMVRDHQLMRVGRDKYAPLEEGALIPGRVTAHKDGFGFLIPDDGSKDLFLSPSEMRVVFHGDRALVRESGLDKRGRREGQIIKVLEHNTKTIVGRVFFERDVWFVEPEKTQMTQDILLEPGTVSAKPGQLVVVELTEHPTQRREARGKIIELLGDHMAPGMEIDVALRSHNLPHIWPQAVLDEIASWTENVPESAIAGRKDLRHLPLVTIDGEDARDFDDAIYVEKTKGGYTLYVAIADVSYYVKPGSALDEEAKLRGTSVYFPAQVIPMLPEVLSNGLCSLKPKVDRLCMVCEMNISNAGIIKHHSIYEAVMNSKARLTYTKVAALLSGEPEHGVDEDLVPHVLNAHKLFEHFYEQRLKRGAIDFDTTETKILFDDQRKISQIVPVTRNQAHRLIEECMLAANETVAKFLEENKISILYRVHDTPNPEKITALRDFLKPFGLVLGGGDIPTPKNYAQLMEKISPREDKHMLQTVLLRSLNQAIYTPENIGHFGLAYESYAHFTSPIRRYPDLMVHRALKAVNARQIDGKIFNHEAMLQLGDHCSMTERRADEAVWDVMAWLKCEYMQEHVGETFEGIITGVTGFGLFVELKEIFVEGLVHVSNMKQDHFKHDQIHHMLVGERTGQILRISDKVRIKVARVDLDARKIDFELLEQLSSQQKTLKKAPPSKR
jgi:ribonuclease R